MTQTQEALNGVSYYEYLRILILVGRPVAEKPEAKDLGL